jgi:hypothetical protein
MQVYINDFLRIARLALAGALVWSLVACGGGGGGDSATSSASAANPAVANPGTAVAGSTEPIPQATGTTTAVLGTEMQVISTSPAGTDTTVPTAAGTGTMPSGTAAINIAPTPNATPEPLISYTSSGLLLTFNAANSLDTDGTITSYAWSFGELGSAANSAAGVTATHAYATSGTYAVTVVVTDNSGATASKSIVAIASPPIAIATGKPNDTGAGASQCYVAGTSSLSLCNSGEAIALNADQDGARGLDATANSSIDGKLGFSFTKIGASGESLPASATLWSCIKDNVTGLMWEVKTSDGGLRDQSVQYTNFDSTASGQLSDGSKPSTDQIASPTNSTGFRDSVNASGLCGANDWRLPTALELPSLIDYGSPTFQGMDNAWFPNSQPDFYWSSSALSSLVSSFDPAQYVWKHANGLLLYSPRSDRAYVRLVRSTVR